MISWMTAPVLYIAFPLILVVLLGLLASFRRTVIIVAVVFCLLLALTAILQPLSSPIQLGRWTIELEGPLNILGRSFSLGDPDRFLLAMVFGFGAFWFVGSRAAGTHRFFVPLGLIMMSLLVSAVAVKPFLYSALLIEMAALAAVPMLVGPGQTASQGVMRFIIFQTLAIPFILLAGWVLGVTGGSSVESGRMLRAVVLLGLGFAFWLAVFPFYSWVPMLAKQAHPYSAGFVLTLFPGVGFLLAAKFLSSAGWVSQVPQMYPAIQFVGLLMIATGGMWAAFQEDAARLMGYAIIVETGFALISLSFQTGQISQVYAAAYLPRVTALAIWALSLSLLRRSGIGTTFDEVSHTPRRLRWIVMALCIAVFSLGGFPLLGTFPVRLPVIEQVAGASLLSAVWLMVGVAVYFLSAIRLALAVVTASPTDDEAVLSRGEVTMLALGCIALVLIGLFPGIFLSPLMWLMAGG